MYAIIESGGKQYRVAKGDEIDVELLDAEQSKVTFDNVLFFSDGKSFFAGSPKLEKYSVEGEVVSQVQGPKVIAYKYKRRKNYHRKVGHRQKYLRVRITELKAS